MALSGAASMWKVHFALMLVQLLYAGGLTFTKATFNSGGHPIAFSVYRDIIAVTFLAPVAYFAERKVERCPGWYRSILSWNDSAGHQDGQLLCFGYVLCYCCPTLTRFLVVDSHRGRRPPLDKTTLAQTFLLGFTGEFAGSLLFVYGIAMAPAAFAPLVPVMIPIFAFLISTTFGVEVIQWRRPAGQAKVGGVISACLGGILIPLYRGPVIVSSTLGPHNGTALPNLQLDSHGVMGIKMWQFGAICLILAALANAIQFNIQAQILKKYTAILSLATATHFFGGTMLAVAGLLTIQTLSSWVVIHSASDAIAVTYTGILSAGAVFYLQSWAISRSGPMLTASYAPLTSVVTTGVAYFILGESIHLGSVLGMLLIISGLLLITWGQVQSETPAAAVSVGKSPTLDGLLLRKNSSSLEQRLLA